MADFSNIENQIDNAITTNGVGAITGAILNAILKGMLSAVDAAKEDTLTFDLTPTEDSTKPVTSGGVYDALDAAAQAVATTLTDYYTKTQADGRFMHIDGDEYIGGVKTFFNDVKLYGTNNIVNSMLANKILLAINGEGIDMNGMPLTELPTPTADTDAANKKYVDDADALKANDADVVHLTGNENIAGEKKFTEILGIGNGINMNGTKVERLGTPTADDHAATKKYVDDGLATKQDTLTIDAVPTDGSDNPVASNGVYDALAGKQDTLTIDAVPTDGSDNPVASNGVYDALAGKQDTVADLATIRSGAAAGATAVQPADLPTISTDILMDYTDDTKTASPKAVFEFGAPEIETALGNNNSITPNVMYQLGTLSGTVTFILAVNLQYNGRVQHYYWTFDTGATAPTVNWPADITAWVGGSAPTISANKHYEISIIDGIAAYFEV